MKWKPFIIVWALAASLLLFAHRRAEFQGRPMFKSVVDLSHSITLVSPDTDRVEAELTSAQGQHRSISEATRMAQATKMISPAASLPGMWDVAQIPAERLVRPLVVLDVTKHVAKEPAYRVGMEDIVRWEEKHGAIPPGAVVLAYSGWGVKWSSAREYLGIDDSGATRRPAFSDEAARFLVQARQAVALGIDAPSVSAESATAPPRSAGLTDDAARNSVYLLENVANLGQAPENGALVTVTPLKVEGAKVAPVRIVAVAK